MTLPCSLIRVLLIRKSKILTGNPELAHHGVQGCAWQPETGSSNANQAPGLPENADYIFTLHFGERPPRRLPQHRSLVQLGEHEECAPAKATGGFVAEGPRSSSFASPFNSELTP